jgi:hypothetical protein
MFRRLAAVSTVLAALLLAAPVASAHRPDHHHGKSPFFGSTTLAVDPGTLGALGSLGVSPGAVPPAQLNGATYAFPITSSLRRALRSGVIRHVGGISLTTGGTTVELTDFDIVLGKGLLFGRVNGGDPTALLDLDYSRARIGFRYGRLVVGPIGTTLTQGAADALNTAFGVSALSDSTVIGDATVRYRLFPF